MQIHSLKGKASAVTVKTALRIRDFFAKVETIRRVWQQRKGGIPLDQFVYWKRSKRLSSLRALKLCR